MHKLSYVSTEDVAKIILTLTGGAMMAKVNIKNAYGLIPAIPIDIGHGQGQV